MFQEGESMCEALAYWRNREEARGASMWCGGGRGR